MVERARIRAESLTASAATISATAPPLGSIKSVAIDVSGTGFPRQWTFPVWTAETLHRFWTASIVERIAQN